MIESRDPAESIDAADAADPIDSTDAAEPIEPTDSTEPIDPIEHTEPRQPMHRNESSDHRDHLFAGTAAILHRSGSQVPSGRPRPGPPTAARSRSPIQAGGSSDTSSPTRTRPGAVTAA